MLLRTGSSRSLLFSIALTLLAPALSGGSGLRLLAQNQVRSERSAVSSSDEALARAERHANPDWLLIQPHLPDPATASPDALMLQGDILHARRFDEDALEFYGHALARGGEPAPLLNRIGVLHLFMQHPVAARAYFEQVIHLHRKDAAAWNNLGATEFLADHFQPALSDYRKAVQFSRKNAIFHANLGTAYFELKDYESAQREFLSACKLDPAVFHREYNGGIEARVLSASDRGRFNFEMAKIAARQHDEEGVLRWLTKASEAGLDIRAEMGNVTLLQPLLKDPRVIMIVQNTRALRNRHLATAGPITPLPSGSPQQD